MGYNERKRMRNSNSILPFFMQTETQNYFIRHFIDIFIPILRIESSNLSSSQHFSPILLNCFFPCHILWNFRLMQYLQIAPALFVSWNIAIFERSETKGRRSFSSICKYRYCKILISAIRQQLSFSVQLSFILNQLSQYNKICINNIFL